MKDQIVQAKVSVDKRDLIILSWHICHQPIRQLVHSRNVSSRSGFVLLCPSGHLLMQKHLCRSFSLRTSSFTECNILTYLSLAVA